ncbi:MAG: glycosyltransferase family A protein [Armatimonadota bacterium]
MESVSVIIPTYNSVATLARALQSVLAQTRPADEIIVVDDGSTDDTRSLVTQQFPQVGYHFQPNAGLAATRNAGAKLAQGSLIALLDSDDEWVPTKLQRQLKVLAARPDLSGVGCHRIRVKVTAQAEELWRRPSKRADGGLDEIDFAEEMWGNRICGATMIIRRDVFDRAGGYDASLRVCEDLDLWLRLLGAGEHLAVLREALYVFYDRPGSLRTRLDQLQSAVPTILGKWNPQSNPAAAELITPAQYEKICKWWWLKLTFHSLRLRDPERARHCARQADRYRSGVTHLEWAGFAALHCPALFALVGTVKGFPRLTG